MDSHEFLSQAPGAWGGDYQLWFSADDPPVAQSPTRATITRELRGSGVLLRYDWRYEDDTHEGLAIINEADGGGLQMGWSDTFHAKHGVMHNTTVGTDAAVLGQFGPDDAPWGWRTEFAMPSPDSLEIRAFVIKPDGSESLSTQAVYQRLS